MPVLSRRAGEALAADRLHLIVLPTEKCNFRCVYCYEDFRIGVMSDRVAAAVEVLLTRRTPELRWLDISWFGGEPLLARGIMTRLLRHVERLRTEHPLLGFRSDVTTNGYLLDRELFLDLHGLGVSRFQVSFDGWGDEHDRKRRRASGAGTFARIWDNLRSIRRLSHDASLVVRLHLDKDNLEHCRGFLARVRDDFEGDPRFPVFLKPLGRWGGAFDGTLRTLDREAGAAAVLELSAYAASIGVPLHRVETGGICYAARRNSFVIRSDGRINKCTMALEAPENQVGELEPDGRIRIDRERLSPWLRGLWTGSPEALACPKAGLVGDISLLESA